MKLTKKQQEALNKIKDEYYRERTDYIPSPYSSERGVELYPCPENRSFIRLAYILVEKGYCQLTSGNNPRSTYVLFIDEKEREQWDLRG